MRCCPPHRGVGGAGRRRRTCCRRPQPHAACSHDHPPPSQPCQAASAGAAAPMCSKARLHEHKHPHKTHAPTHKQARAREQAGRPHAAPAALHTHPQRRELLLAETLDGRQRGAWQGGRPLEEVAPAGVARLVWRHVAEHRQVELGGGAAGSRWGSGFGVQGRIALRAGIRRYCVCVNKGRVV